MTSVHDAEIEGLLQDCGGLLKGPAEHYILTSGLHSEYYLQCALLLQYPKLAERVGKKLADKINPKKEKIDVVIGPALGGIILAHEVAKVLGARTVFAERENGVMVLRRGFKILTGEAILAVEDVVTTGGSVSEVVSLLTEKGLTIKGVGAIVDRSGGQVKFPIKFESLVSMPFPTYSATDCPLCKRNIPAVKPGSRSLTK